MKHPEILSDENQSELPRPEPANRYLAFYNNYFPGMTRKELKETDIDLYRRLSRGGLLKHVPKIDVSVEEDIPSALKIAKKGAFIVAEHEKTEGLSKEVSAVVDADVALYRAKYAGITRGKLQELDPALYQRLRKKELLSEVPKLRLRNPRDFEKDPLEFYRQHYAGITRGVLQDVNPSLYQHLRKTGLLNEVPLAARRLIGKDPMAYYSQHYAGMTRYEIFQMDHSLYETLRLHKLLKHIPLKRNE
ncbi:MAG: hypothetical protein HOO67_01185 [Candidatus Peribacteraceae bacterium]|nr:hypothetical protein [Candidatus Peribacteraceae bacterium]